MDARFLDLAELYGQLEREIGRFQHSGGVRCPAGCSVCCTRVSGSIETSVLEMMPVALAALEAGVGPMLLNLCEQAGDGQPCVFYREGESGGCSIYPLRGLTCRVFGFSRTAPVESAQQIRRYYACRILRDSVLDRSRFEPAIFPLSLPSAVEYRSRLEGIDPTYATPLYGINEATARAIRALGLPFFFRDRRPAA